MKENIKEESAKVYEIGYLLVSSLPEEKVAAEVAALRDVIVKKGATMIGEEAPELRPLAYTMTKKMGQTNHRFDRGYFGWFKFELNASEIESVKKSFEENTNTLRTLIITTVKENTYLGKKSPVPMPEVSAEPAAEVVPEASPIVATTEEIDKSIDAMVKEA